MCYSKADGGKRCVEPQNHWRGLTASEFQKKRDQTLRKAADKGEHVTISDATTQEQVTELADSALEALREGKELTPTQQASVVRTRPRKDRYNRYTKMLEQTEAQFTEKQSFYLTDREWGRVMERAGITSSMSKADRSEKIRELILNEPIRWGKEKDGDSYKPLESETVRLPDGTERTRYKGTPLPTLPVDEDGNPTASIADLTNSEIEEYAELRKLEQPEHVGDEDGSPSSSIAQETQNEVDQHHAFGVGRNPATTGTIRDSEGSTAFTLVFTPEEKAYLKHESWARYGVTMNTYVRNQLLGRDQRMGDASMSEDRRNRRWQAFGRGVQCPPPLTDRKNS